MWLADDRRFVFVTGKGGVGKTTVTAALARAVAGRGRRVLVAMCNAKERISTMFGCDPIGPSIAPVAAGIWAVNIDPEEAFAEYGQMVLKVPGLYRAVFQNRYVRSFLPAVPGLAEWAILGKAWFHTTEMLPDGRPRFDLVLLDAPATGHGLDMLRVPKVIIEVVPPGVLRRDAERAWTLFQNPLLTAVVVVTVPEELPTTETLELVAAVRGELNMPLGALVINNVVPTLFSDEERDQLIASGTERAAPPGIVGAAVRRAQKERLQAESFERLRAIGDLSHIELPHLLEDAATPKAIGMLAERFSCG
jgi:anion-transporting  ArsA/GET3 family ATPase